MNFYTLALTALEPASVHKSVSAQILPKGSKFMIKNHKLKRIVSFTLILDVGDEILKLSRTKCHQHHRNSFYGPYNMGHPRNYFETEVGETVSNIAMFYFCSPARSLSKKRTGV